MKNRRCRKTIHKTLRRYVSDIWGRLAIKKRDNFITTFIYNSCNAILRKKLRTKKKVFRKKILRLITGRRRPKLKQSIFQYSKKIPLSKRTNITTRSTLIKLRKKISLYYGGGLIRRQTFRRYGKLGTDSTFRRPNHKSVISILESRLDVLLLRANFVDSIYTARKYVINHHCKVQGFRHVTAPGTLIRNFQIFKLKNYHLKSLRNTLFIRLKKHAILCTPSYLFINFKLIFAFKLQDPFIKSVSYPFADKPGSLALFRKLFHLM